MGDIWEGGEPKSYSIPSSMMPGKGGRGGELDGARLALCGRTRGVCREDVGVGRRKGLQGIGYK